MRVAMKLDGSRIRQILLKLLCEGPGLKDVVAGLGQSCDPHPVGCRSTFVTDDQLALAEDWQVVGRDIRTKAWRDCARFDCTTSLQ